MERRRGRGLIGATILMASGLVACSGDGGGSAGPDPGPAPIRRLIRVEYNNTVRDLLGDTTRPADAFAPEEEALGFHNNAETLVVSALLAEQFMAAAEALAARAVEDLDRLLPCDPAAAAGPDACAREFIEGFGGRAFRRPLAAAEVDRFQGFFVAARDAYGFEDGIRMVIEAMLQSPHFLYRVEHGREPASGARHVSLTSWEMAARLSYLFWGTMPDEELFTLAAADRLQTPEQVLAQAMRMAEDPRTRETVLAFHRDWLGLHELDTIDKDLAVFPEYRQELREAFKKEIETFIDHVIWEGDANFRTLFTAHYSFMNRDLAELHGVSGPSGSAFERVELPPERSAGLLSMTGLMAVYAKTNQSSPIHRGKFVREKLLCQQIPPPPEGFVITPPDLDPNLSTRERFRQHAEDPFCGSCHVLMDPIGFGFEAFDGLGRFRPIENGRPVDDSGEIVESDIDGAFHGPVELGTKLAGSSQVRDCVATEWFRYAYGRVETDGDVTSLTTLRDALALSDGNIRELLLALTQTDAFLLRRVEQP